jgi:hypothetical protein
MSNNSSILAVLYFPIRGSFLENIRLVFPIVGLELDQAEAYETAFFARYSAVKNDTWCNAFCLFSSINSWVLRDMFGLDPSRDNRIIRANCDTLWRVLTGENPHVPPALQPAAIAHLKSLGIC